MSETFEYGPATGDEQRAALGEVLRTTFHFSAERVPQFFHLAGHDNLRVIRQRGCVVGGLIIIHMGQYFGGRAVKMAGIAAVGIDQHLRGQGAASVLMSAAVREMHALGYPVSALFPATQPLYQRVGYEQAGTFYRCVLPIAAIDSRARDLTVRPITDADQSSIEKCYRARARRTNGHLDRTNYVWTRVRKNRTGDARGFLVEGDQGVEGYVFVVQQDAPTRSYNLYCPDLVALTQRAAMRLLKFFADHRSMAGEVIWHGSPTDALHLNVREQHIADQVKDQWMLRLLDAGKAIEARGYAPGVTAQLHLDIHGDTALPDVNNGRLLVHIQGGQATAQRGQGRGEIKVTIRGLASLYAGMITPWEARAAGWLEGDDGAITSMAAAFAGGAPWIADHF